MKALLLAAMLAAPAAAQHEHHGAAPAATPAPAPEPAPAEMDHGSMDHGAMDHGAMDHSQMDHSQMGHGEPDQGTMDHGAMDHQSTPSQPMDHGQMDHSGHAMPAPDAPAAPPPERAFSGPRHAADPIWGEAAMAPAREQLAENNGEVETGVVRFNRLEARFGDEEAYLWDVEAEFGGDLDELVLKSEGEGAFDGELESADVQALWGHAISPWFDLQTGVRYDIAPRATVSTVLGIEGRAPYNIHLEAAVFLSERGDATGRIEAEHDWKITQRLILQPRAEIELAAQDVPELDLGAGLSKIEAGLRLRYEIVREFAPYIGVGYETRPSRAGSVDADDDEDAGFAVLAGIKTWF